MTPNALIDLLTALWLGFIGACIGSFLNVVAYRMPLGMSVIWNPSHCPKCNHAIRAYDNVPVLGWLWLKGRCRDCSEPISPRYAIVEFVMGLVFFLLAYVELFSGGANLPGGPITEFTGAYDNVWLPQWKLIAVYAYHGLLLSLLMSIALVALDGQKVPRRLFWFGVLFGIGGVLIGIRRWLGLDGYNFIDWGTWDFGRVDWVSQAVTGAGLGWLLGVVLSGLWKGSWGIIETKSPIAVAGTLVGLYLGQFATFIYLFGLTFLVMLTLQLFVRGYKKEKSGKGGAEIALFVAVVALLLAWKQLDAILPLYGTSVPSAELQLP